MAGITPRSSAMSPNSTATERSGSATTICRTESGRAVAAQPLSLVREPQPERRRHLVRVERHHRHARLDRRDHERVVEQVAAAERAVLHPVERGLLGGRAVVVGVDPDLAEEDPVGPRDRLLAQVDRLAARVAVAQLAQALLDLRRRAARAALVRDPSQPQLGELDLEVGVDPARSRWSLRQPSLQPESAESGWLARNSRRRPPRSANRGGAVGHPVEVEDRQVLIDHHGERDPGPLDHVAHAVARAPADDRRELERPGARALSASIASQLALAVTRRDGRARARAACRRTARTTVMTLCGPRHRPACRCRPGRPQRPA